MSPGFCRPVDTIWTNLRNQKKTAMPLLHYTDLNAVVSILNNPVLRCTDLRYLNDRTEFKHGIERLRETFKTVGPGFFINEDRAKDAELYIANALDRAVSEFSQYNPYFVMSLSRSSDLLSQWRGYGAYAIEFHEEELIRQVPSLSECVYDKDAQRQAAFAALTDSLATVSHDFQPNDVVGIKGADAVAELYRVASTFKNFGFVEEQEARLIIDEIPETGVQYRIRGQVLIPFIEIPISLDCIKAIHVGPMPAQDEAILSMTGFCERIERDWRSESANIEFWIEIISSNIPFRAG